MGAIALSWVDSQERFCIIAPSRKINGEAIAADQAWRANTDLSSFSFGC